VLEDRVVTFISHPPYFFFFFLFVKALIRFFSRFFVRLLTGVVTPGRPLLFFSISVLESFFSELFFTAFLS